MPERLALGFSDHSGWAVMAIARRTAKGDFELVSRARIQTCPSELSRQPYHAVAEQGAPNSTISDVMAAASELSSQAITTSLADVGPELRVAAVAMGRMQIPRELDRVLASHALLHSAEGELYRDALSEAAAAAGLRVVRFLNKEVRSEAAAALGWPLSQLEDWLAATGKAVGKPWTRDEKDATAAAMLALATVS